MPISGVPLARQRKVTICARVQETLGLKVVSDVPEVIPCSTAHATAPAYQEFAGTSVKPMTCSVWTSR